jgi:hypothetical protein
MGSSVDVKPTSDVTGRFWWWLEFYGPSFVLGHHDDSLGSSAWRSSDVVLSPNGAARHYTSQKNEDVTTPGCLGHDRLGHDRLGHDRLGRNRNFVFFRFCVSFLRFSHNSIHHPHPRKKKKKKRETASISPSKIPKKAKLSSRSARSALYALSLSHSTLALWSKKKKKKKKKWKERIQHVC